MRWLPRILERYTTRTTPWRVARFFLELRALIEAGVPVARSLDLLRQQEVEPPFREVLGQVSRHVQAGHKFSTALATQPDAFNNFACRMMAVGERVGYGRVLREVTRALERQEQMRRRFLAAVRYPVLVLVSSTFMLFVLLRWVLPGLFACAPVTADPPIITRLLSLGSDFANLPLWLLGLLFGISAYLVLSIPESWLNAARLRLEKPLSRLPVFGQILSVGGQIQICHTLSAQLRCGVLLAPALRLSADACTIQMWRDLSMRAAEAIREGAEVSDAFRLLQPPHASVFLAMIALGDEVGEIGRAVEKAALLLEDDFSFRVDVLAGLLGPCLLFLSSGLVMLVLLGAMLPLRALASGL